MICLIESSESVRRYVEDGGGKKRTNQQKLKGKWKDREKEKREDEKNSANPCAFEELRIKTVLFSFGFLHKSE